MTNRKPAVEREQDLIGALARFSEREGCAPSHSELAAELGVSKTRVYQLLAKAREDGLVAGVGRKLRMVARTERMQ